MTEKLTPKSSKQPVARTLQLLAVLCLPSEIRQMLSVGKRICVSQVAPATSNFDPSEQQSKQAQSPPKKSNQLPKKI